MMMNRLSHRYLRTALLLLCVLNLVSPQPSLSQTAAKRAIGFQDFDSWRNLQGSQISRDGKFVAYVMQPQDGDGELFVKSTSSDTEWRAPRGYRPPTPPPDASDPAATQAFQALSRLLRPIFSADGKYLFFTIEPNKAEIVKARKDKKKPEDMPKNALGIMDLSTGKVTRIEDLKSFQVPEDGSGYVAVLKEAQKEERKTDLAAINPAANKPETNANTAAAAPAPSPSPTSTPNTSTAGQARPGAKKEFGAALLLRRLSDGQTRTLSDVTDYTFSKDGRSLVFAVSSRREDENGAYVLAPGSSNPPATLAKGAGKYTKFTWDEKQTQLAFISDRADASAKRPKFDVYHWRRTDAAATQVVTPKTAGFKSDYVISEKGSLAFSYDGSRLLTSSAPPQDPEPDPSNAVPDEEKVSVDLWHWKEDYVQPMQKIRAIADRDRSYRGVWHIQDHKFVQISDPTLENVSISSNGLYAIGSDDRSYRIRGNYDGGFSDYYLVNTLDGSRKLLLKESQFGVSWSPNAKYAVYFDGKDWNSISIPDGKVTNITSKLKSKFAVEDYDSPSAAPSYGLGGWTAGDKEVLINDRYDIWAVSPDGSGGKMLTDGTGRREKTEMRYVRLDPEERFISPGQMMLLRAENEETRDSGFYQVRLGSGTPERLMMDHKNFNNPTKAKDADLLMFSATRFDQFPDVWVANSGLQSPRRMSNGDAQRMAYTWGTSELIRYKSKDGIPLQGVLIKPDNFDPKKKYPMIVYLYEKLSDTVNNFQNPGPGTSINWSFYTSNDYVVFMPDIVYKVGYPGKSALNCVLGGVDAVVDKGFIDVDAIGIQGHSWGGYQIAYMVTQTKRFKAAAPGALVSNMFSAYNGIRWGSGQPRQFQYERTQSRIGGTPWNATSKFMENSPLFYVEKVTTPILMLHNDNDDAVPWYQGIEFYLSLRRLGKEVYFFNYNGEYHGLRKRQNQKDYTRRMKEFFDHFLKGAPAPDWMQKGIPYLQREKEKEQYRQQVGDAPETGESPR
jgi:dipeptidyl aminopeptidase/acylaminoacyl peptidase